MLVLGRKKGDRILIGNDVAIVIVDVTAHRVRIGIQAPDDMTILRAELVENDSGKERDGDNGGV